jgi:N-sulfoglucosamine sulfohydrolase
LKLLGGHFYELCFGKRQPDELYDLRRDPEAVNNLAGDLALREKLDDLRYRMMQMLREEQDPRALGEAAIFDTYKYVGSRNKGYETWLKAQEEKLAAELKAKLEAAPAKKARKAK